MSMLTAQETAIERPERRDWSPLLLAAPNVVWLLLFMAGALGVLAVMSLRGYEAGGHGILPTWEVTHYRSFLTDPFFLDILARSLLMSLYVTF